MGKLKRKEIDAEMELENGCSNIVPENAHSAFHFEIKETTTELIKQMKSKKKKRQWKYREDEDGFKMHLDDLDFYCSADISKIDGGLSIITALSDYKYVIKDMIDGGADVTFYGPLNGLLTQNLLPKMTYVPHTLEGKFIDKENGQDLTEYMHINEYVEIRRLKNSNIKNNYDGVELIGNPQDCYGVSINARFNNEIPVFSKYLTAQEYKNKKATALMEDGYKNNPSRYEKAAIKARIEVLREKKSEIAKAAPSTEYEDSLKSPEEVKSAQNAFNAAKLERLKQRAR